MGFRETQSKLFGGDSQVQPEHRRAALIDPPPPPRKSALNWKTGSVAFVIFMTGYTTIGEVILPYSIRWSTVSGTRAGNTETAALGASTKAAAAKAAAEEAARQRAQTDELARRGPVEAANTSLREAASVAEQVKGEQQKADIQVRAAGQRVYSELPGTVETERQKAQVQLASSCVSRLRDQAVSMMAQCLGAGNPEQTCELNRDLFLDDVNQRCGIADNSRNPEGGGTQ